MEKTSGGDLTSLWEYNRPPRPSRNTLVIIFHEIRYSMTRRIRYALNGIDTHLTCFCASGPTSDRPMNAIKRDAMRVRTWASISSCGNPRAVTYLSRQRNDLAHPWTRFTALIYLTYAISTLFPRAMRSEFQLTCDRTQCIFYHAIRFRRACTVGPGGAYTFFGITVGLFPKRLRDIACV